MNHLPSGLCNNAGATAPAPTASPVLPSLQKEQLLALVRALARDAARADHAAEQQG